MKPARLRDDALAIWHAALRAVDSARLVRETVSEAGSHLLVSGESIDLNLIDRIAVVGAGKAGAGMAAGLLDALGPTIVAKKRVTGWLNVPADCVRQLPPIVLHAARAAGSNEPTAEGVAGADAILSLVGSLGPPDLCFCLISGGASALLPAPLEGITLADKLAVTRHLSAAGANIVELNTVRKQLSRIKGGGLARACRAGRLLTLIISDVIGDPLDVIASGPTVADTTTPLEALAVLEKYDARQAAPAVLAYFESRRSTVSASRVATPANAHTHVACTNVIIGNNAAAVDAAAAEAHQRGYTPDIRHARELEGLAEDVGTCLAEEAVRMRDAGGADCIVSGGEPVVKLAPEPRRGLGGRNQQLALAAFVVLDSAGCNRIALAAGGTDGEDGPTDAAGAIVDADVLAAARRMRLVPTDYMSRNDAYHFFGPLGGLIKTGPTHTNVGDVRVVVIGRDPIAPGRD
jgi:hydroxypyruvate reductase